VPLDASGTDAEKVLNQTEQQVMRRLSATHSVFVPMAALAPIPVTSVPALTTSLVSAIQHDDLTVQYQPIVQLDTSEVVGLIAHASWTHPTVGSLTPQY
jgi:sensor c-di-GMP phosphodiesterase-like protein